MKRLLICLCIIFAFVLSACTAPKSSGPMDNFVMEQFVSMDTPAEWDNSQWTEAAGAVRVESYDSAVSNPVSVTIQSTQEQITAKDGTPLFAGYMEKPEVTVGDSDSGALRINSQIDTFLAEREQNVNLWKDEAAAAYETAGEDFYAWSSHTSVSLGRVDENCISILFYDSAYLGGQSASNVQSALNFDAVTGSVLPLASIFKVEKKGDVFRKLMDRLEEMKYTFDFYDDYRKEIINMFNNIPSNMSQNWYLTDTGIVFFFLPERVSPNAAGAITIELTYTEVLDSLRDDFMLPNKRTDSGGVTIQYSAQSSDFGEVMELPNLGGDKVAISAEGGPVYDVRIYIGRPVGEETTIERTIYAANLLPEGATLLVGSSTEDGTLLGVSYNTGGTASTTEWVY